MSQVKFFTENLTEVVGGWDRMTSHFHFTMFDDKGEAIWCNVEEGLLPEDFVEAKRVYELALKHSNVQAPEGFWETVASSRLAAPNKVFVLRKGEWVPTR